LAKKEKDKKAEGEEPKKKKSKLLLFIIIGVVLILVAGGAAAYFFLFSQPSDKELAQQIKQEQKQQKPKEQGPKVGVFMPLDPFIVNLADPQASHFLKATITLELVDDSAKKEADKLLPAIRNDIIILLSSQTMDDVITTEGKMRLRDQIITRLNHILGPDKVKNVYFSQFIVQ